MTVLTLTPEISEYEQERGKPMPGKNHGLIQGNITIALGVVYREIYSILTEVTLQLSKVYTPLTVIEIRSPTQGTDDITEKFAVYFDAGVKSIWLVEPVLETIAVILPDRSKTVFHQNILTDTATQITLDLNEVFC
jgi:Uma2 family endonuclease